MPDAPATGLIDVPQDAGERLVAQAARFGAIELSRAADIVAAGLTEMRGATAPRLLLELLCARVLLPGADHTSDGVMARLERLERRLDVTGAPAPPRRPGRRRAGRRGACPQAEAPAPATPSRAPLPPAATSPRRRRPCPTSVPRGRRTARRRPRRCPPPCRSRLRRWPSRRRPGRPGHPGRPGCPAAPAAPAASPDADAPAAEQPAGPQGGLSLVDVRRLWPDILEQTKNRRRLAWMVLSQHAHVVDVDGTRLTVGFANAGARDSFVNGGCDEILRQAAIDVVGMDWRVESIVDPSGAAAQAPVVRQSATATAPAPGQAPAADAPDGPPAWVTGDAAPAGPAAAPPARRPSRPRPPARRSRPPAPAAARRAGRAGPLGRRRRRPRRPRRRVRRPRHRVAAQPDPRRELIEEIKND